MPGLVQVGLLGPLRLLSEGGVELPVGPAKERAVLAVLALRASFVVSSAQLMEALWGEDLPVSAAKSLQNHVSGLRKTLPGRLIETSGSGYRLRVAPDDVDAGLFVQQAGEARQALRTGDPVTARGLLVTALGWWRGDPLVDLVEHSWGAGEAARLVELRLGAEEDLFEARLELGEHGGLVGDVEAAVAAEPLRERRWGQLMLALYRCGRQADALRAFQRLRRILADEFGLEPTAEIRALEAAILAQDAGLRLGVPAGELPAAPAGAGNLPARASSFVGRQRELAALISHVQPHSVVALVGPGGAGKSRLAVEAAHRLAGAFPDGRWLCELAAVASSADVSWAVAGVLRARPAEGGSILDAVVEYLRGRCALLIVDNCEHVLDAAAELVTQVTAACPTVAVLVTSREPLAIPGEEVWPISGLDLAVDAPALFRARARTAHASQTLSADDDTVAEVCARLDGLPLAIELAAARARTMTVTDLAARLDDRFRLLQAPARGRPGRHQTLLAAVDWSYQLLDDRERLLFDRLSVFPGTFNIAAAVAMCASSSVPADVVDELVHQLVDKSVVVADRTGPTTRFRLLETLREFGARHLPAGARPPLETGFADHYLHAARRAGADLVGPNSTEGRAWFRGEWHNVRAAAQVALAHQDQVTLIGLLQATHWYAEAAGVAEVGAWAEAGMEAFGPLPSLLGPAAFYAHLRGDTDLARTLAETGIAAAGSANPSTCLCWKTLFLLNWYGGNPAAAYDAQLRVVALTDPVADPYAAAFANAVAGGIAATAGSADGRFWLDEAARIAAPLRNATLRMWLTFMGAVHALGEGHAAVALEGFCEAELQAVDCEASVWETRALTVQINLAISLGRPDVDALCFRVLTRLYTMRSWSDLVSGCELMVGLWAGQGRLQEAGTVLGFLEANDIHHSLATIGRAAAAPIVHGDPDGERAVQRGAAMSRDELVTYVLERLAAAS